MQQHAHTIQRALTVGWLLWITFVVYGSLFPFEFRSMAWNEAVLGLGGKLRGLPHVGSILNRRSLLKIRGGSNSTRYQDKEVDYEALNVQRNAPRWIKMLRKHGFIATPAAA